MVLLNICMDVVEEFWISRQVDLRRVEHAVQHLSRDTSFRLHSGTRYDRYDFQRQKPELGRSGLLTVSTRHLKPRICYSIRSCFMDEV